MARPILLAIIMLLCAVAPASADEAHPQPPDNIRPELLKGVGFDMHLGRQLPADLSFKDDKGRDVRLSDYFNKGKPVILSMNYFECPTLCPIVLDGVLVGLQDLEGLDVNKDFTVVSVSVDHEETPKIAAASKENYTRRYTREGLDEGWHFLTGSRASIDALAKAVGVRFTYDAKHDQWVHPSGITMLTPEGKVKAYLLGVTFNPRDLKLGLVEAASGKIGSVVDQAMLFCFQYDPQTGKYGPFALGMVRLGGIVTLLAMGTFMITAWRREARQSRDDSPGEVN